jgi:hypothetical protein
MTIAQIVKSAFIALSVPVRVGASGRALGSMLIHFQQCLALVLVPTAPQVTPLNETLRFRGQVHPCKDQGLQAPLRWVRLSRPAAQAAE